MTPKSTIMEDNYHTQDELCDENGAVSHEYCAHIYIAKQNEIFFAHDSRILPDGNTLPLVRNGTLTFIEHEGITYGVTCGHVLDALNSFNGANETEMSKYCEGPLPEIAKYHFFVSIGNQQHHVRGNFHKVPPEFGIPRPDIAIAHLPPDFVSSIGRKCIKMSNWPDESALCDPSLTGIACGYPEMNRTSAKTDVPGIETLGKEFVALRAKFDSFSKDRIRILDKIAETKGVNVLSGMSGGPLFWSTKKSWGLAGIIKVGGDLNPNIRTESEDEHFEPTINVVAEPITKERLESWTRSLPNEKFPESLSTMMYVPKNFKGFRSP